ncbi:MAG: hypothetical protein ABSA85_08580 [Terracidiphilus sp.]|jgi:hypothetical protein
MIFDARRARQKLEQSEAEGRAYREAWLQEQGQLLATLHKRYIEQIASSLDRTIEIASSYKSSETIYEREKFYKEPGVIETLRNPDRDRKEQLLPFNEWEDAPGMRDLVKKLEAAGYRVRASRVNDCDSSWGYHSDDRSDWKVEIFW